MPLALVKLQKYTRGMAMVFGIEDLRTVGKHEASKGGAAYPWGTFRVSRARYQEKQKKHERFGKKGSNTSSVYRACKKHTYLTRHLLLTNSMLGVLASGFESLTWYVSFSWSLIVLYKTPIFISQDIASGSLESNQKSSNTLFMTWRCMCHSRDESHVITLISYLVVKATVVIGPIRWSYNVNVTIHIIQIHMIVRL